MHLYILAKTNLPILWPHIVRWVIPAANFVWQDPTKGGLATASG